MGVVSEPKQRQGQTIWTVRGFACLGLTILLSGCGISDIFNTAFLNTAVGGYFPATPGPAAKFILIRAINGTDRNVEFIVTIEKDEVQFNPDGTEEFDNEGNIVTETVRETVSLTTFPNGQTRELGVLFPCGVSPIKLIGLGENLNRHDARVYVDGEGPDGARGSGVIAEDFNPLALRQFNEQGVPVGQFNCGDTVIFRAIRSSTSPGGVQLQSLLLPGSEQPSEFPGRSTFVNYEQILESQGNR